MSLSIQFTGAPDGDDGPYDLGSAGGWHAFADWVNALPAGFDALRSLVGQGTVTGTHLVAEQLRRASKSNPPPAEAAGAVRLLRRATRVGDPDETATVTGVG